MFLVDVPWVHAGKCLASKHATYMMDAFCGENARLPNRDPAISYLVDRKIKLAPDSIGVKSNFYPSTG